MIRVLFVDDEPKILDGLRRMLRAKRHEWEMAFANSGQEALDLMADEPFDVVVSDMRMPGMDGAKLLNEVQRRHPTSVRIILSGQADRAAIVEVVSATHQFLSKPCDPDLLAATIDRACGLRGVLNADTLRDVVSQMQTLPSRPVLYEQLKQEAAEPDPSMPRISQIIQADVAMSAKVLQLVNSAFFGLRRSVVDVRQAVSLLGLDTIVALVLAEGVFGQFRDSPIGLSLERLWAHSITTASYGAAVARSVGLERREAERVFTACMLHDIGYLVLASSTPDAYQDFASARESGREAAAPLEREIMGATHGEVGAYLLGLWGLPDDIVEAVAYHVEPSACAVADVGALAIVHTCDVFARYPTPLDVPDDAVEIDHTYLESAGLGTTWLEWRELCAALVPEDADQEK